MAGPEARSPGDASAPFSRPLRALILVLQDISRPSAVVLAILWATLVWVVSSRPPPISGPGGDLGNLLSNLAHAPEYGALALWLALAIPRESGRPRLRPGVVAAILAAIAAYAALDEIHQSFTPHRDASAFDAVTDVTGATATLACLAAALGPRAAPQRLRRRLILGSLACGLAAALATFAPRLWPGSSWL